ncbi:MAG: hypothetical protein AB1393_11365 [Candidatus Edwardsbacteria bacterium]
MHQKILVKCIATFLVLVFISLAFFSPEVKAATPTPTPQPEQPKERNTTTLVAVGMAAAITGIVVLEILRHRKMESAKKAEELEKGSSLAILPFIEETDLAKGLGEEIRKILVNALLERKTFNPIISLQDQTEKSKTKFLLKGTVSREEETIAVNLKLLKSRTGETIYEDSATARGEEALTDMVKGLARRMAEKI